ncbi:MAG: thiol:disulfide interchange protein DsbA/DsbL [Shewanella sp.]|nr:thiol:disulfide interchange protein DsbA/DsbL [Shewanella sp.]MCF1430950.1 thiol:disulfide interchange protein DsbA/DsbL [Shewanella sp.]MCF1458130.1 thiol:disulfide interchange protein DsbA/DsbL [Shewanella sp.]
MFKKAALALTLTVASMSSYAATFYEGKHYTEISDKAPSAQPSLTEFFSFYCHNCFAFESQYMPAIKPHLNKDIKFETKHVEFQRSDMMTEVMRALAVIHQVAGDDTKKQGEMSIAMFTAIQGEDVANGHDHGAPGDNHEPKINSRDDIKKLFMGFGVSTTKYDELADNNITDEKLALWRKQAREFRIQSVPSFIVNEKYMVNLNQIRNLGEMIELINYLSTKKS